MASQQLGNAETCKAQPSIDEHTHQHAPVQISSSYHDHSSSPTAPDSISEYRPFPRFPEKLYGLLARAGEEGYSHIISWQPHGRCFIVHNRRAFTSQLSNLMPGMKRWKSFQRQLSFWGFTRLVGGPDINGYYHENFLRYRPHLLSRMQWRGQGDRERVPYDAEPDFYTMPFLAPVEFGVGRGDEETPVRAPPGQPPLATCDSLAEESQPGGPSSSTSNQGSLGGRDKRDQSRRHKITSLSDTDPFSKGRRSDGEFHRDDPRPRNWAMHASSTRTSETSAPSSEEATQPNDDSSGKMTFRSDSKNDPRTESLKYSRESDQDLEPRPLPPVLDSQGNTSLSREESVTVSRHPGFVQIGPNEFCFRSKSGVDETS
jgi:HSF-type DNA-binding